MPAVNPAAFTSLDTMRHSAAHILAAAIMEQWPQAKLGVGPVIDTGFYYDVDTPTAIGPQELQRLQKRMEQIIARGEEFVREEMPIDAAIDLFKQAGQKYKTELLKDLKAKGTTAVGEDGEGLFEAGATTVTVYRTGKFVDLCRGPHVQRSKEIGAVKLRSVAGAYWRGKDTNPQLQRIYGTAFPTQAELDAWVLQQEEAEKRDHRKVGKDLDLFVFSDRVGKGLPLWTPKGATVRRILERFVVDEELRRGYLHVYTPDIANLDLYKTSGHYPYYKDSMYAPIVIDEEEYMLRPMTCPHHFELYLAKKRSYRELPMRIAELAKLYRYEQSGELTGLIRVRSFCLADAHIVAMPDQAASEVDRALDLIEFAAKQFGLKASVDYSYRLSLGDRADEKKYFKDDAAWDAAENVLRSVLKKRKVKMVEAAGEAAFYGPKIDIQMRNIHGKDDTAFTVQYDFVMPKRFSLRYIDKDGQEAEPVVIHRSSIGAIERIMAFLIERYAGAFPMWLAPVQVQVVPVSTAHAKLGEKLAAMLRAEGIRAESDGSNETVGYKIRKASQSKVPYMVVVGDKEKKLAKFNVRIRGKKTDKAMTLKQLVEGVKEATTKRKVAL